MMGFCKLMVQKQSIVSLIASLNTRHLCFHLSAALSAWCCSLLVQELNAPKWKQWQSAYCTPYEFMTLWWDTCTYKNSLPEFLLHVEELKHDNSSHIQLFYFLSFTELAKKLLWGMLLFSVCLVCFFFFPKGSWICKYVSCSGWDKVYFRKAHSHFINVYFLVSPHIRRENKIAKRTVPFTKGRMSDLPGLSVCLVTWWKRRKISQMLWWY